MTDYSTHKDFGGDEALLRLRDRCHARGLRLMVDFVPNHMAVDHPWTKSHPELLIQGSENSLRRERSADCAPSSCPNEAPRSISV